MLAVIELYNWITNPVNQMAMGAIVSGVFFLAEAVTRMTPTESDDGFVTRAGQKVDSLLKFLPNNIKRKKLEEKSE